MLVQMQNRRAKFSKDCFHLRLLKPRELQLGQQLYNALAFFTQFGKECGCPRAKVRRLQWSF
jgi:hypothetical protein